MSDTQKKKLVQTAERLGIKAEQIPRHIAIIMDGNGRWATKQGKKRFEGHLQGAKNVEKIALYCSDIGIEALSLYSFSMQNWKRPRLEVMFLMQLYTRYLVGIRHKLQENDVKLIHLGRKKPLPGKVLKALGKTIEVTKDNAGMVLALALNYGGREEIVDSARNIAEAYKKGELTLADIDEKCLSDNLYTCGLADVDLLIRTSDELRVSNFLLWQISYAEFYVTETLWPDLTKEQVDGAIIEYSKRSRRFGDIKPARAKKSS